MRKIYALLLTVFMTFSLTACNSATGGSGSVSALPNVSAEMSAAGSDDNSKENSSDSASQTSTNSSAATENSVPQASIPPQTQDETSKILVAYFSATNTTKGIAERVSDALGADLYEITPAVPYTSADLNYHDDNSRTSIEMNDPNARPAISGSVSNMEQYDIVFLGYPIWWGEAPRILDTFVESCDFTGKTVVPFCTSGSSGVGSSATNLEILTSGGTWLSGTRFSGGASKDEIVSWINGLGLNITAGA